MSPVNQYTHVRAPAVAGMFYPSDPGRLKAMVQRLLHQAESELQCGGLVGQPAGGPAWPKAVIAPHAGYMYSGPIAAAAYTRLAPGKGKIGRVVMIGPAHRVAFAGLAVCGQDAFATPLGPVAVDQTGVELALRQPGVQRLDSAHAPEHALEVHLPFLIEVLGDIKIVPLLFGQTSPPEVARVLEALWGGEETVILVSSDLSHYLDMAAAHRLDRAAADAIEALEPQRLAPEQACGRIAIQGLLEVARVRHLHSHTVDLRTSGDTAGPQEEVVGYGAFVLQ